MPKVDFIIVGQGIAGTCLAIEFLKRGKTFLVVDKPDPHSASQVAAGLFNPITGRTNQATWKAGEIFPAIPDFYLEAEKMLEEKFLTMLPIYRPFISGEEKIILTADNKRWIKKISSTPTYQGLVNDLFGGIEIQGSGFVNTLKLVAANRKMIATYGHLMEEELGYKEVLVSESISYKKYEAASIIFCDGVGVTENPWFHWAPIQKLKGELILAKANLPGNAIINRGIFSVPTSEQDTFVIGSTYHRDASLGPSATGIGEILARSAKLFTSELEIISQSWGHRPATIDRRPLLGQHPAHKNICIFNGLGTKGISLAPYFAVQMADWLEGKTDLDKEVNIERFYSLYFNVSGT
jgi:glycine oxidase